MCVRDPNKEIMECRFIMENLSTRKCGFLLETLGIWDLESRISYMIYIQILLSSMMNKV